MTGIDVEKLKDGDRLKIVSRDKMVCTCNACKDSEGSVVTFKNRFDVSHFLCYERTISIPYSHIEKQVGILPDNLFEM